MHLTVCTLPSGTDSGVVDSSCIVKIKGNGEVRSDGGDVMDLM
jgi:hypothetical protein